MPVCILSSCQNVFLHFDNFILPENITEQLQCYFDDSESQYLIFPVYVENTNTKRLILDTPYFVTNFTDISEKFDRTLHLANQHQLAFFIIDTTGGITAIEISSLSIFNDYSLSVCRSNLSQKWKEEIFRLMQDNKMMIHQDSWVCIPLYHFYTLGSLHISYGDETLEINESIKKFIFDLQVDDSQISSWRYIFIPVGQKYKHMPTWLEKKKKLIFEELSRFDEHYNQLYKINGRVVVGKNWFAGKIAPNIRRELDEATPEAIIFMIENVISSDRNEYDCLRNYAKEKDIDFFYHGSETEYFIQVEPSSDPNQTP